ncbi:MAG: hypothetical protein ACOX5L_02920 [Bacteroidales bacterium]|jgi:hypothetical protein
MKIVRVLFVIILICSTLGVKGSNPKSLDGNDSIVYTCSLESWFISLTLRENLDFQYEFISHLWDTVQHYQIITGTYLLSDTKLFLNPISTKSYSKHIKSDVRENFEELKYESGKLKIKTFYDIITWANKAFLISPQNADEYQIYRAPNMIESVLFFNKKEYHINDYYYLADYYHRERTDYDYCLPFLQRTLNSNPPDYTYLDLLQIPKPFMGWFELSPTSALVTKCDSCSPSNPLCVMYKEEIGIPLYIIEINKGSSDHIRPWTPLYDDRGNVMFVIEVEERKSIVLSTLPYPIDYRFTTKWLWSEDEEKEWKMNDRGERRNEKKSKDESRKAKVIEN